METGHRLSSLEYKVIKKNIKNINISINERGEIIVTAPLDISYNSIEKIMREKIDWISKSTNTIKNKVGHMKSMGISEGKNILWLGKLLKIERRESDIKECHVEALKDKIIIYGNGISIKNKEIVNENIRKFYKEKAEMIFNRKVIFYSKKINVHPHKITMRCQKTRWGSCSSNGNLSFNYKLLMAPLDIIDYIVVHELCHLIYMNHSGEYWNLVGTVIPQYLNKRNWLKNNGYLLRFP
ncbi:M48 family metallopeptidase [Clostridium sp. Mt-5]|uniref:M48 family metallopeptidase n=1 Tax=Clostridium moutaii TaxID=3240932 RepID=A0ABV4BWG6_9CLOT